MDDEDLVRKVAGKMLEFLGYEVVLCGDGAEAMALYRAGRDQGHPFDAVLLDLQVPGGQGGASTLSELLRLDPKVKAVISSGYGDSLPEGIAIEGHAAVIGKPYEMKTLEKVMGAVLGGDLKRMKNEK